MCIALYSLNHESPDQTGQYAGLTVVGEFVFMVCVIVANVKVMISSFRFEFGIVIMIGASIGLYCAF